jgi:CubicO group peptidase (beta-lactamase class C family)
MNPDELKQAWQALASRQRLTIDADVLLKEVRHNERNFRQLVLWRDVREVGAALVMVPVWIYLGARLPLPWTWYLCVPALLWIAGFMLVDRMRQQRRQPRPGNPLRECVASSLAQVEHQAWLLRNVFWWYLLPPGVAVMIVLGHAAWQMREAGAGAELVVARTAAVVTLVFGGVYWLNRRVARKGLEPRRQELQTLLESLEGPDHAGSRAAPTAGDPPAQNTGWRGVLGIVLLCAITATSSVLAYRLGMPRSAHFDANFCPAAGDMAVTNFLVPIRQKHRVPAIAAALVTSKGLVAVGVVGTRKQGTETVATLDDKWHLGSDGKAMTATLIARLVEQGRLNWDATLAEVFPDLASRFAPDVRTITVLQLLSHRSGLTPNPDLLRYGGADGRKERLRILENELGKSLPHKPGTHYEYSNLGYAIVGAIAEKITGKPWEQAMQDEVFGPLGMTSVGFGGTGTPGQLDQPWGHHADGTPVSGNGPAMDNAPVLSPAGRVHCTIQDWTRFIADQLRGDRGEPALLKPETYRKLHTPPFGGDYALGWGVQERDWGGGTVLQHCGDNTMNFANVWVAPRRDFAVLACVNQSGDTAFEASDDAVSALIKLHSQKKAKTGP